MFLGKWTGGNSGRGSARAGWELLFGLLALHGADGELGEVLAVSGGALGVFAAAEFEDAEFFAAGVGVDDGGDAGVGNFGGSDGDGAVGEFGELDFVEDGFVTLGDGEAVEQDGVAGLDAKLAAAGRKGGGDSRIRRGGAGGRGGSGSGGHWKISGGLGKSGKGNYTRFSAGLQIFFKKNFSVRGGFRV